MQSRFLILVAVLCVTYISESWAFRPGGFKQQTKLSLCMKSGKSGSITSTNVQLSNCEVTLRGLVMTDGLQEKLEKKVMDGVVLKLGENMVMSTHITMSIDPKAQSVDIRCNMKGGATIEAKETAENMYTSIDLASKTLR